MPAAGTAGTRASTQRTTRLARGASSTARHELHDVMRMLAQAGTAQTRKTYRRHGAPEPLYGVSFKKQDELVRLLKTDHELAQALWASGNADARYLALRIADPARITFRQLEAWARDFDHYVVVEIFARRLGAQSPHACKIVDKWTRQRAEWKCSAGWAVLANLAMADNDLPDAYFAALLSRIEDEIGKAHNRVRHEMNGALIAIGTRSDGLARKATAAARRIGPVEVDHGQTGCKTPQAVPYIAKARAHRKKRSGRR